MVSTDACILNTSSDKFNTQQWTQKWALRKVTTCAFTESYISHNSLETNILKGTFGALLSPSLASACDCFIGFAWKQEILQTCNWEKNLLQSTTNWWVTSMDLIVVYVLFFHLYIRFIIHSCIISDDFVGIFTKDISITQRAACFN